MAKIFESHGLGTAAEFVRGGERSRAIRELDAAAKRSRGLSVSGDVCAVAQRRRRATGAADGPAVSRTCSLPIFDRRPTARLIDRGRRSPWRRSSRRKPAGRRASARRRGVRESAAHRHAAPVRSDGHLRAAARRHVQRQSEARRPVDRFAVQHLRISGPAARAIASPGRAVPRGRRAAGAGQLPVLRVAATTARTHSPARWTSTTETSRNIQVQYFRERRAGKRQ